MSGTDGQEPGGAPQGDGSHKGTGSEGWTPPRDGSWLPKVRVDELIAGAKAEAARAAEQTAGLRAEMQALKDAVQQKSAPKPLSRADLNQLVADGKVTQEAADAEMERQVIDTATTKARQVASDVVTQREREGLVTRELDEYRGLIPAAWETGSKERAKVEAEYRYLVGKLGYPDSKATEVAALRAAFGDPELIKASRSTGRSGPAETHSEVGGAERGEGGKSDADSPPKGLAASHKAYYEKQIQRGLYADWNAVREELKFSRPKVARA